MKSRWFLLLAMAILLTPIAPSQEKKDDRIPAPCAPAKGPDLRFTEDGKDLLVSLMIEGPAARQIVLTDYTIFDGKSAWDEPPIGVEKPRRPPKVELRYLVLINRNLPGFMEKGLMSLPTPQAERQKQRQEVVWRLSNFRGYDIRKEDTTFSVSGSAFEAWSEELKKAIPAIKQTVDKAEEKPKGGGKAP
jgi:hypothetical protein